MTAMERTKQALANSGNGDTMTVSKLFCQDSIKMRFQELLGQKSAGFISSVISIVNSNTSLKGVNPQTVLSAAVIAATLDLPVNQSLGFAYIVPYKGQAQFQLGYKGFVQLAIRTGQYKTINATEVFEGEIVSVNRLTGRIELDETARKSEKIVGYAAYFELINGFEKTLFMTTEQIMKHAERYSQSYVKDYSPWKSNFPEMALKTVLKRLLSKYGIMSIQMQTAMQTDQAVVLDASPTAIVTEYPDNETEKPIASETNPETPPAEPQAKPMREPGEEG